MFSSNTTTASTRHFLFQHSADEDTGVHRCFSIQREHTTESTDMHVSRCSHNKSSSFSTSSPDSSSSSSSTSSESSNKDDQSSSSSFCSIPSSAPYVVSRFVLVLV